ncbi:hypothetical protein ACMHYB_30835 [Sorangium sp. So ce1128]
MEASTVWTVWRRILREPALGDMIFEPGFADRASEHGFTAEQIPIVLAYAETPHRTRWFIVNYRFRLVSSFLYALETGAPLTVRLLVNSGHDLRALGERYMEERGWEDHGPFVYTFCADVLDFLRRSELAAELPYLRDMIALEAASVELVRRVAKLPRERYRLPAPCDGVDLRAATLRRNLQGITATTEHALGPWLRDKSLLGRTPLQKGPQHLLLYVPSPTSSYKLAGIPERGARLFNALTEPRSLSALRRSLGGDEPPEGDDVVILRRLCEYGVVEALRG